MKGIVGVLVGVLVVILIIVGFNALQDDTGTGLKLGGDEGRVYFGITDDTADIQSVNEIELEVEKIEMYSATKGWTTVSSNSETYSLLELKANGRVALHEAPPVVADVYSKVRLTLGDVTVDSKTQGRVEAVLPSPEIMFDLDVSVENDVDSHVVFDFIADKSLHTAANSDFVFAAVVEAQSESNVSVTMEEETNSLVVVEGEVDDTASVGVDLDGSTKSNFTLDSSQGLEVNTSVSGPVTFTLGSKTYTKTEGSQDAEMDEQSMEMNSGVDASMDANMSGSDATVTSTTSVDASTNADGSGATLEADGGMDTNLNL